MATTSASAEETWTATHYGESYNGQPLGCGGTYQSRDDSIGAIGPANYGRLPCGSQITVTGPAGSVSVERRDSCPGCSATLIDLSEAAHEAVCGPGGGICRVTVSW